MSRGVSVNWPCVTNCCRASAKKTCRHRHLLNLPPRRPRIRSDLRFGLCQLTAGPGDSDDLEEPLRNTIIVLIGFAGTGKYTIGRELCRRTGAKLVDNHLINNSLFTVVNADGLTPLPGAIWSKVRAIRQVVLRRC